MDSATWPIRFKLSGVVFEVPDEVTMRSVERCGPPDRLERYVARHRDA